MAFAQCQHFSVHFSVQSAPQYGRDLVGNIKTNNCRASSHFDARRRQGKARRGFFEGQQSDSIRKHLPEWVQPVADFAYVTRWRKSEILGLQLVKDGKICPWVFNRKGKPRGEFKHSWKTACTNAGLPGRLMHDFRGTAVRNLVRPGIPERAAMKMTGHKT